MPISNKDYILNSKNINFCDEKDSCSVLEKLSTNNNSLTKNILSLSKFNSGTDINYFLDNLTYNRILNPEEKITSQNLNCSKYLIENSTNSRIFSNKNYFNDISLNGFNFNLKENDSENNKKDFI